MLSGKGRRKEIMRTIKSKMLFLMIIFVGILLFSAAIGCPEKGAKSSSGEKRRIKIPTGYQKTYIALEKKLDDFDGYLNSNWDGKKHDVIFGSQLLVANAHRGKELLTRKSYKGILLYLDRLQSLGIQGVTISIGYPILAADFPNSGKYVSFYEKLAQEIRNRGLKLHVETGILFTESAFTSLSINYKKFSIEKYKNAKKEFVRTIVERIRPDYLSIGNEPSIEGKITGLQFTVKNYTDLIRHALDGVKNSKVLIGAGAGTWDDPSFIKSFAANTDLDFIDIHIYPVDGDNLQKAIELADIAKSHNKKVIVGEAWLYKAVGQEAGGGASWEKVMARDVFNFWEPVDEAFINVLVKLAHYKKFEYISPFWTKYFFGYLDYASIRGKKSSKRLLKIADKKAVKNLIKEKVTGTGNAYRKAISGILK